MLRRSFIPALLVLASLASADTPKRLILKDGSYQKVTKYEVKNGNVHYLSAERYAWEDIPADMIDWPATEKYEKSLESAAQAEAEKQKHASEEISPEDAQSPEVGPNLRLPKTGGAFALDETRGSPQLVELTQTQTQTAQHTASTMLKRKINPVADATETIELPNSQAKTRIYALRPSFYFNIDTDSDDDDQPAKKRSSTRQRDSSDAYRFRLIRLEDKHDHRLLATLKIDVAGATSQKIDFVPVSAEVMPGGIWIKIEPQKELPSGEYAIVELISEGNISGYVWDFSTDTSESGDSHSRSNPEEHQHPRNPAEM
jgi:hypothetical protein